MARCSGHLNVYRPIGMGMYSRVDELLVLDAHLMCVSASIIKPLMQCSVKLDDMRLKKSS